MVCFVKLMALPGSVAVCSTCNGFYAKSGDNVKRYRLVARLEEIP